MSRVVRALVAVVVLIGVGAGAVVLVRASDGDYSGDYHLSGLFPRAGEGLQPGSEVVFRGVQVGRVSTISLRGAKAQVSVLVQPTFRVPADTVATIQPVNLFGAEEVALTTPHGKDSGPYLVPGATFSQAASSDELGDLFAAATPLLNAINTTNLANVVSELAQASAGEGPRIAAAIDEGSKLASFLDATLQAQLAALDSFASFSAAVAPDASTLNGIASQANLALPTFNRDVTDYQHLLESLTPFANQLAAILTDYHPDIATLLADGDNVARLLTVQQSDIGQVIDGAYQYTYKIGNGTSAQALADGSHYAYFNTFIVFADVNQLVCSLIAPSGTGLSFLEPLQQALAGAGSAFNCSSQIAAFTAAQSPAATAPSTAAPSTAPSTAAPSATAPSTSAPSTTSPSPTASPSTGSSSASSAAQGLENQVYGILGQPSQGSSQSVGGYINSLAGGL